jgi:hypothetical protein
MNVMRQMSKLLPVGALALCCQVAFANATAKADWDAVAATYKSQGDAATQVEQRIVFLNQLMRQSA